eukprot:scaffold477_cov355-Pinguiococcus_pyrenoidosus.AAC.15
MRACLRWPSPPQMSKFLQRRFCFCFCFGVDSKISMASAEKICSGADERLRRSWHRRSNNLELGASS